MPFYGSFDDINTQAPDNSILNNRLAENYVEEDYFTSGTILTSAAGADLAIIYDISSSSLAKATITTLATNAGEKGQKGAQGGGGDKGNDLKG